MKRLDKHATAWRIVLGCLALALVLSAASPGDAQLKILRVNKGGTAPTNAVGGGTLSSVFNAAADWWESAIGDTHTVTIEYSWGVQTGSTLAAHTLGTQGGSPNRETKGSIVFDNDGSSVWFIDPSPTDHLEFTTYTETSQNFGGGSMNKGRVYTGATGNASGRSDLLGVAIHEIGHALGLSGLNTSFITENADGDVDIRSPLPFAGSTIPTISGAHLNVSTALMYPTIPVSLRRLGATVDILCNAEISKFTNVTLKPGSVCQNTTVSIPDNVFSNRGNCIPLSECIGGGEGRFQWFIDRSRIGCAGLIKEIDVLPTSTFSFTAQNFEVRISHTTQTSHSTNFATNLPDPVVVRTAGNISFNGTSQTWSPLGLQKGFYYDGTRNLTIEVRMRNLKASPTSTVYCDSATATPAGFLRTYALGAGTYSAASTTTSRTNTAGALKIRLHFGQAICNPSDTPGTGGSNSWPFNTYNAWRYQFIINSSVLPNAPMKITDIAFAPTSTKTWNASRFQMRMGHTTKSDFNTPVTPNCFDDMLGPCPTIVYEGPLTWDCAAGTWSPIGFQSHFGYDGSRNILVEIRYSGGPGSSGVSVRTDTSINRAYTHTNYTKDPYNAPCWYTPIPGQAMGAKHCLDVTKDTVLIAPDTVRLGTTTSIRLYNGAGRQFYQLAASLSQRPGIAVGNCMVYLGFDNILLYSLLIGPPLFNKYGGQLSSSGAGTGTLLVPVMPALVGFCVYHAGVVYTNKGAILSCSNTDGTQIVR